MAHLSEGERWTLVALYNEGHSIRELAHTHKIDRNTVRRWIRTYERTGTVADAQRAGRPSKVTCSVQTAIKRQMANKQRRSSRYMAVKMRREGTANISYRTVQRAAHTMGYTPYHIRNIPNITPECEQRRVAYAHQYANTDWRTVLFSDEKKFNLYQHTNNKNDCIWAFSPDNISQRKLVKNSPSVVGWGGICYNGKTHLHYIHGRLDSQQYIHILQTTLLPATHRLFVGETYTFQHDSAPYHTSATVQQWLNNNNISYIPPSDWPPNSPDFNPIENLWSIVNTEIQKKKIKSVSSFKTTLSQIWNNIHIDTLHKLIDSIPHRLSICIQRGGKYTQ